MSMFQHGEFVSVSFPLGEEVGVFVEDLPGQRAKVAMDNGVFVHVRKQCIHRLPLCGCRQGSVLPGHAMCPQCERDVASYWRCDESERNENR